MGRNDLSTSAALNGMRKQITVYRVDRDPKYAKLVPVDRQAFNFHRQRSWSFNGMWPDDEWVSLEMRPSDASLPAPDIWQLLPGAFALERKAFSKLCSSAEETQQGRMNFLKYERRSLAVVHSTLCLDCLDKKKSLIDKKTHEVKRYEFDGTQLAISLFKIPETRTTELYTLEGFDGENDFKTLVERYSFTGLRFRKLWTGESWMNA